MSVHTQPAALKLLKVAFEARYDEGYRYLDRCGETLVRIRKYSLLWVPGPTDPQRSAVSNPEHQLTLNLGNESLIIVTNDELIKASEMDNRIAVLAKESEALYKIIVEALNVPNTTRVGVRCQFLAEADALEEANRFMCRALTSPLRDDLVSITKNELRNTSSLFVLEDPSSGLRRRIELSSVVRMRTGSPSPTGLASDQGSGGILVDIDTFTRPEEGHFAKVSMFIRQHCAAAKELAIHVLEWLLKHQH